MTRYLDAHNHFMVRDGEERDLLDGMDEAGVEKSVLLAMPTCDLLFGGTPIGDNEAVLNACRNHPDRFIFFLGVDPRDAGAAETVRRYAGQGARGVKLFPPLGFYPDDPVCIRLYEIVAELGLVVLSHTGATNLPLVHGTGRRATASHFADPIRFDGLARLFPEIKWILAHMGYPWSINAWTVAAHNRENVYLDLCGGGPWMEMHPFLYESIGRSIPIDFRRVLWGTDRLVRPKEHLARTREIVMRMGCEEAELPFVFGETARGFLGC